MTVDHDGEIRMDCSSPYAMARLINLKDEFQVAFANDSRLRSDSLPLSSYPLLAHAPSQMDGECSSRQDICEQQHDRQGG